MISESLFYCSMGKLADNVLEYGVEYDGDIGDDNDEIMMISDKNCCFKPM